MTNFLTRLAPAAAILAVFLLAPSAPAQCLEGNCVNGTGVKLTRGHKYSGSFENNHRQGYGAYYFPNGDRYEGQFEKGLMHGEGAYIFASGDRYEGEFKNNTRTGVGTYFYENGEFVKGVWENGKLVEPYAEVVSEDLADDEENPDTVGVSPWGSFTEGEDAGLPVISREPDENTAAPAAAEPEAEPEQEPAAQPAQEQEPEQGPEPDSGPPTE